MGKAIWIGATVVAAVAMVIAMFGLGIIDVSDIPIFPGLPKCTADTVYYTPEQIEAWGISLDRSTDSCICSGTAQWEDELTGKVCVPIDNTKPDCTQWPFQSTMDCRCNPPDVYIYGEDGNWNCGEE